MYDTALFVVYNRFQTIDQWDAMRYKIEITLMKALELEACSQYPRQRQGPWLCSNHGFQDHMIITGS